MKTIIQVDKDELMEIIREALNSSYDPVIGFDRETMMEKLGIKSVNTFYDRLKRGKIVSREVGGSHRYFFP